MATIHTTCSDNQRFTHTLLSVWFALFSRWSTIIPQYTWSDNEVRELATVCLPWQHWTKALVWFHDVDISAFHNCVVVDLWQSLSEWHLLLSACVSVCRRENVGAWIRAAKFLATKQITVLEHPAYSLDLACSDFFLFLKMKEILKGMHFDDIDDIRSNTTAALKAIPQNQFQNCFEGRTRR